jgi:hypothetical protein
MNKLGIILICLSFTGCATIQKQNVLDSWVGSTDGHLLETWNTPTDAKCNEFGEIALIYQKCVQEVNKGQLFAKALAGFGDAVASAGGNQQNSMDSIGVGSHMTCELWYFVLRDVDLQRNDNPIVRDRVGDLTSGENVKRQFYPLNSAYCDLNPWCHVDINGNIDSCQKDTWHR